MMNNTIEVEGKATLRALTTTTNDNDNDDDGPHQHVPPIFTWSEFLHYCVPGLADEKRIIIGSQQQQQKQQFQQRMLLIPSPFLKPLVHLDTGCHQSLTSLVDDVVWTLVQRREVKSQPPQGSSNICCNNNNSSSSSKNEEEARRYTTRRNILCQGYSIRSEDNYDRSNTSHFAMVMQHLNSNVDYCKTSALFRNLHCAYGDDIVRLVMMHTSVFVLLLQMQQERDDDDNNKEKDEKDMMSHRHHHHYTRWNFLQVTGPPISSSSRRMASLTRRRSLPSKKRTYTPRELASDNVLPRKQRRTLFYSNAYIPKVGLGCHHILSRRKDTSITEPKDLLQAFLNDILQQEKGGGDVVGNSSSNNNNTHKQRRGWIRWKEQVLQKRITMEHSTSSSALTVCKVILQKHRSTDYHRLLERYCPLMTTGLGAAAAVDNGNGDNNNDDDVVLTQLSTQGYSSHAQVTSWLRSVVRRVFPVDVVWGGTHNQSRILDHLLPKYVSLRRDEHFANKTLLHGMRITQFRWLVEELSSFSSIPSSSSKQNNNKKKKKKASSADHERSRLLVLSFLRWFFSEYLTILLRSVFFVTESEFSGKQVLYYRKPVWARFRNLSLHKLIETEGQYQQVSAVDVGEHMTKLGMSRLRLLPKATGVRPIATLCKQEALVLLPGNGKKSEGASDNNNNGGSRRDSSDPLETPSTRVPSRPNLGRSTNTVLDDAFAVLKYEQSRKKGSSGVGLDGLHYFYPRYLSFIREVRKSSCNELYFGSVDIRHCFDNIDQEHLLNVVESLLTEEDYLLQKYKVVHPSGSTSSIVRKQKKEVRPLEEFNPFYEVVDAVAAESHRSVFVDGVSCVMVKRDQVLRIIREHLTNNLVATRGRHGSQFLRQKNGIPQGSVLSTRLCNVYYGSIEKNLCGEDLVCQQDKVDSASSLLVRMVDDFMLVSVKTGRVEKFVEKMSHGDPRLGVEINKKKTKVSSNAAIPAGIVPDAENAEKGEEGHQPFPWCGMLFHTVTGEVSIDYSRLLKSESTLSLTVERARCEGDHLAVQMKSFVRPRCIPILFDSEINTSATQTLNFYQLMVLAAVKTFVYLQSSDMADTLQSNVPFLLSSIESTSTYACNLIDLKLRSTNQSKRYEVNRRDSLKVTWQAFLDVCGYATRFHFLLVHVQGKLAGDSRFAELHHSLADLLSCFFS